MCLHHLILLTITILCGTYYYFHAVMETDLCTVGTCARLTEELVGSQDSNPDPLMLSEVLFHWAMCPAGFLGSSSAACQFLWILSPPSHPPWHTRGYSPALISRSGKSPHKFPRPRDLHNLGVQIHLRKELSSDSA